MMARKVMAGASGISILSPNHPDKLFMYTMEPATVSGTTLADVTPLGNDAAIGGSMAFGAGIIGEAMLPDGVDDSVEPPGAVQGVDLECMIGWFFADVAVNAGDTIRYIGSITGPRGLIGTGEVSGALANETFTVLWADSPFSNISAYSTVGTIAIGWHLWGFNWNGSGYDIWIDGVKKTTTRTVILGSPPSGKLTTNIRLARRTGLSSSVYGDYNQDQVQLINRPLVQSEFTELFEEGIP